LITAETFGMVMGKGMEKTLTNLDDFYLAGQWVESGGGVPTVAASGRGVIRIICKSDKKKFRTSLPAVT